MLKNNLFKLLWVFVIVVLLVLIRTFESDLFYDPFLSYFKKQYFNLSFPEINSFQLSVGFMLRYFFNSALSIALLWVVFRDRGMVNFVIFLYLGLFFILLLAFLYVYHFYAEEGKMSLFYIRRFLIQPIFILLFLPGFYYQKKNANF